MDIDPELGDTILHKAGYIIRQDVHAALLGGAGGKKAPSHTRSGGCTSCKKGLDPYVTDGVDIRYPDTLRNMCKGYLRSFSYGLEQHYKIHFVL